ncbi:conserved hypothetical protein [Hahella chejuensis KCTC 2396]|uniref:Uncharacterized protein n=1 Tax=Hahella chejuensis (strain KCTC 2396) TaxID=349521 RepID=Q2S6U8_HAHCH|nr:hypothetical protein [Hahella chejuensis]ABC33626.1 conserved hypothetical protein [Hahella chejuensis KCTC 2396]
MKEKSQNPFEKLLGLKDLPPFQSPEELQRHVERAIYARNSQPLEDLAGLSAAQMYDLLYHPYDSPEIVRFPEIPDADVDAPIITLFLLLAEQIGEQGIKPTAKGNLPRKLCQETALAYWGEELYLEDRKYGAINQEEQFFELHLTKLIAELAGLIRKYKGKLILSRKCRDWLGRNNKGKIYHELLRAYTEKSNWAYVDGYPELYIIQRSFVFTLYLLKKYSNEKRGSTFYEDCFIKAYPDALKELPNNPMLGPNHRDHTLRSAYSNRALFRFAHFFGLVTVERVSTGYMTSELLIQGLPLLDRAVQFPPG